MTRFGRFPLALLLTAALAAFSSAGVVRVVPEASLAPLGVPQVLIGSPGTAPLSLTNEVSALSLKVRELETSPVPSAVAPLLLAKAASPVLVERAAALIVAGTLKEPAQAGPGAAELAAAAKTDPALAGWFDGSRSAPLELDGLTYKRGSWRRGERKLERLGQGEFGFVDAHPTLDGTVIKTVAHSAGVQMMSMQSPRTTSAGEKVSADLLAAADAGPRHFGNAVADGLLVSVRERVYGRTLEQIFRDRSFGPAQRALVENLLRRMAANDLMTNDLRPSNIMIGHTFLDPRTRAYVVDGGGRVLLPANLDEEGKVAHILRTPIVLRGNFVRDVGWIEHARSLAEMMDEALERSSRDTPWKKIRGFFKDLARAAVP